MEQFRNFKFINYTSKAIATIFVPKFQSMKTIFEKEILQEDTSDTLCVTDSTKNLI